MTATRINPEFELTTRTVYVTIERRIAASASITAPSVTGYTFVCWTSIASIGWVGSMYAENAYNPQTNVWLAASPDIGGNGTVGATALYASTV